MGLYLRVAARTDIGRVRRKNEDAFIAVDLTGDLAPDRYSAMPRWTGRVEIADRGALVAVSDGMGGAQAGELASSLVISSLTQALMAYPAGETSRRRITEAVHDAHRTVWAESYARGIEMGATLTAGYFRGTGVYVAEVGDSRAYLLRAGAIRQLTKDQSYVQMLVDSGAVDPAHAASLPFRNVILQAIGHQPRLSVALGRLELRRRDCLLLCSDGLSNEVGDGEMRDIVLASPDLGAAVDRLVERANERGGRDNVTAVLVGVGGDLRAANTQEPLERTYRILDTFDP
jgi:serine/threonine protein phosphatase PrpC